MLVNNVYGRFASFFKSYELKEADEYIKRVFPNAELYLDYEHADNPPFKLIVTKEEYDERMSKVKSVDTETMADLRKELEYMKRYPEAYKYQRALMMIKKSFIEELKDNYDDELAEMTKEEEANFILLQELVDRFTKESEKTSNEQN